MARLTYAEAHEIAHRFGFDLRTDFHALTSDQVQGVIDAANAHNYRKPRNANGSRARYYHARLRRAAERQVR